MTPPTAVGCHFSTAERFRRLKDESMQRQGRSELYNDEFLTLLLDVWELHLEREDVDPEAAVIDATPGVVGGD